MKILEVGSSQLLSHQYPLHHSITKTTRSHEVADKSKSVYFDADVSNKRVLNKFIRDGLNSESLDLIVFSLGVNPKTNFHIEKIDDFKSVFEVNFFSVVEIVKETLLIHQFECFDKKLSFLFISSIAADEGYPNHIAYATSKAALSALCMNLQREYYDNPNIRFYVDHPPMVSTKLSQNRGISSEQYFHQTYLPLLESIEFDSGF